MERLCGNKESIVDFMEEVMNLGCTSCTKSLFRRVDGAVEYNADILVGGAHVDCGEYCKLSPKTRMIVQPVLLNMSILVDINKFVLSTKKHVQDGYFTYTEVEDFSEQWMMYLMKRMGKISDVAIYVEEKLSEIKRAIDIAKERAKNPEVADCNDELELLGAQGESLEEVRKAEIEFEKWKEFSDFVMSHCDESVNDDESGASK